MKRSTEHFSTGGAQQPLPLQFPIFGSTPAAFLLRLCQITATAVVTDADHTLGRKAVSAALRELSFPGVRSKAISRSAAADNRRESVSSVNSAPGLRVPYGRTPRSSANAGVGPSTSQDETKLAVLLSFGQQHQR